MSAPAWQGRRLHFVGIGGAGMQGWATAAHQLGASVSGSDREDSPALAELRALGIDAHAGHDAANLPEGDDVEVVFSTAVPESNPELEAARSRGLRVMSRAELLGELSSLRRTIAVAGAHGKTTTTSMIAHVLIEAGLDPGYLIGGTLRSTGHNAQWGGGEWLVVEADESDRSLLAIDAEIAVLTNVELDHHATYGSEEELREVFAEFLDGPATAVVAAEPGLMELRGEGPLVAFDPGPVDVSSGVARFTWRGHEVELAVPGEHNALNAAAALEAAALAGVGEADAVRAIASFGGSGRRFEELGRSPGGARVVDDYAHHPTEVAAAIAAARSQAPERLVAVFQPHLFSRTAELAGRFGVALAEADLAVVVDVYPSRERAEDFPGVSGELVADAVRQAGGSVEWIPEMAEAGKRLSSVLGPGDLCLVMGAGDIRSLGEALVSG
ncbi:MAG: UDP-N-acetylmuramate--L-alanine ligase [Solirubrobacterales bacterium]